MISGFRDRLDGESHRLGERGQKKQLVKKEDYHGFSLGCVDFGEMILRHLSGHIWKSLGM